MSYPISVQFNLLLFQAEWEAEEEEGEDGDHILRYYLAQDLTQLPFSDGSMTSTIYSDSEEETCGLTIDENTGAILADIPVSGSIVTRQSLEFGSPGSWATVGAT